MWHELETSVNFRFLSRVWCSMLAKVAPCFVALRGEEKCFQSCTLASRECQVEASGSQNHFSLWHWELREVSSWIHRRSSACISPWFSLARNWWDQFFATPRFNARRHSVSTWHFSHFLMLDWKHFSSGAQWSTLASMEHQTLVKNLKSEQVFNLCHIYGLLFYGWYLCQHQSYSYEQTPKQKLGCFFLLSCSQKIISPSRVIKLSQ
jgi:hypothetical protein